MVAGSRCIQVAEKAWLERGKQEPVKDHSCAKIRNVLNFYQRASQIRTNLQRTVVLMFANAVATMFYRAYCGALKVIEYDRETSMMTILYQGEHNCRPKPNRRKKFDEIRDLTKNDTSIQTPAEARRQVIKSILAKGKVSEAVRVSRKMDDTSLREKMRYMSKEANTCKGTEDDIEAFRNLKTLKQDADKVGHEFDICNELQ